MDREVVRTIRGVGLDMRAEIVSSDGERTRVDTNDGRFIASFADEGEGVALLLHFATDRETLMDADKVILHCGEPSEEIVLEPYVALAHHHYGMLANREGDE